MNFLVGPNGAGKSATLIGIALCLGAKATITNRFKKMSDAIRIEQSQATIRVGIVNIGFNKWRPQDYGTVITVERKLKRDGGSQVRLLAGVGEAARPVEPEQGLSASKELRLILDRFLIQPSNPCTILMQEKAREFLVTSNPKQIYRFWHDATVLTELRELLKLTSTHILKMRQRRQLKEAQLPAMKEQLDHYQQEFEEMQQRQKLAERIQELKVQLAWVAVASLERSLEEKRRTIDSTAERVAHWEQVLAEVLDKEEREVQRQQKAQAELEAAQEESRASEVRRRQAEEEVRAKRREVNAVEQKVEHHREEVNVFNRRISRLEKDLADAAAASGREQVRQLREAKAKLEAEIGAQQERKRKAEAQLDGHSRREQTARDNIDNAIGQTTAARKRVEAAQRRQRELTRGPGGGGGGAGGGGGRRDLSDQVLELIEQNVRSFQKRPIGPVGRLVKVKDPVYLDAVEVMIRNSLHRFLLHSAADAATLRRLCQEKRLQLPPMSVHPFREVVYNTLQNEPPAQYRTVLRLVTSDSPVVINHLIDVDNIEMVLVFDDSEEAKDVLFKEKVPRAKVGVTKMGEKVSYMRKVQEVGTDRYKAKTLTADTAEMQAIATRALEEAQEELARANTVKLDADRQLDAVQKEAFSARREAQNAESALNRMRDSMRTLTRQLEDAENEAAVNVEDVRANIAALTEQLNKAKDEQRKAEEELAAVKARVQPSERQAREAREAVEQLRQKAERVSKEMAALVQQAAKLDDEKAKANHSLGLLRTKRTEAELAISNLSEEVADAARKADLIGKRPASLLKSTAEQLRHEIDTKEARAREEARNKKSPGEIVEQFETACSKFQSVSASLAMLKEVDERLTEMLQTRDLHANALRKLLTKRLSLRFLNYISQRGYTGVLNFDHDQETLGIEVDVDATTSQHTEESRRSVHTLSGGERMFSTVAFLLSIWMSSESPFYALDEFDVFMDALHRTKSLKLFSDFARGDGRNTQLLFISPQSAEGMPQGPDVRHFTLRLPQRGIDQGILNMAPAQNGHE